MSRRLRHGLEEEHANSAAAIWRRTLPVWIALVMLAVTTLGLAYVPLGRWNTPLGFGIAALKAVLIAVFFMNLRRPDPLLRVAGAASMLWIMFLFVLTFADVLTRPPMAEPSAVTPRAASTAEAKDRRPF